MTYPALRLFSLFPFLSTILLAWPIHAQNMGPAVGAYQPAERGFMPQGGGPQQDRLNGGGFIHRTMLGKPCLKAVSSIHPETANPIMIQHFVDIENNCPRTIRVRLCYARSTQCVDADVNGYQQKSIFIGMAANQKTFLFSLTEKP